MIKDRNILVLYSTGVCNLKCRYCFIDKNPALKQIDDLLDKSFKEENYYFDFAKKVFPDINQLKEIQIWGGEPTLNFERICPTIEKLVKYYNNLSSFMFSTNLAHDDSVNQIGKLVDAISSNKNKIVTLNIQLSLDGPTYINDYNRGSGVTEKFSANFIKLVSESNKWLKHNQNLNICCHFKGTWDIDTINKLDSKEKIIKYYQFYELFQDVVFKTSVSLNFSLNLTIPNIACPSPITVDIGKKFANICKMCREIECENEEKKYFKYYKEITPFSNSRCENIECEKFCNKGNCGSGVNVIGLLPDNMISTCHNGFTALLSDYKKYSDENHKKTDLDFRFFTDGNIKNDMVFPYEKLEMYDKQSSLFRDSNECFQIANMTAEIQMLALNNQVDKKYLDFEEAKNGALFTLFHSAYCMRDNINVTGTKILFPQGMLKVFLNGAREYIEKKVGEI